MKADALTRVAILHRQIVKRDRHASMKGDPHGVPIDDERLLRVLLGVALMKGDAHEHRDRRPSPATGPRAARLNEGRRSRASDPVRSIKGDARERRDQAWPASEPRSTRRRLDEGRRSRAIRLNPFGPPSGRCLDEGLSFTSVAITSAPRWWPRAAGPDEGRRSRASRRRDLHRLPSPIRPR